MRTNRLAKPNLKTYEGGKAYPITAQVELGRVALTALLGEDTFYESGQSIQDRIKELVPKVSGPVVAALAVKARWKFNLRHVPLRLVREMARHPDHRPYVEEALYQVIQRPDEIGEFLAMYMEDGKQPLANSVKRGLARAFGKFDEYQLAKWDLNSAKFSLKDAMFLVHPRPGAENWSAKQWVDAINRPNYKRGKVLRGGDTLTDKIATGTLATPVTWETTLSDASDKRSKGEKWAALLSEGKIPAFALIRNLRNMVEAGVDQRKIAEALLKSKSDRILPFRYVAANRATQGMFQAQLDEKFLASSRALPRLTGNTLIMVDTSGSMVSPLSAKSDMNRIDVAAALGAIALELCENALMYTYASTEEVAAQTRKVGKRGLSLVETVVRRGGGGTYLRTALENVHRAFPEGFDRIIIVTDEQSHDGIMGIGGDVKGYVINTAPYKYSVGYEGMWTHISGWSDNVFTFIAELESQAPDALTKPASPPATVDELVGRIGKDLGPTVQDERLIALRKIEALLAILKGEGDAN